MITQSFVQVGVCCFCSDEQGLTENILVFCNGQGCSVGVHQGSFRFCHKHPPPPILSLLRKSDSSNRAMVLLQLGIPGVAGAGLL